jgi:hypothetical protein
MDIEIKEKEGTTKAPHPEGVSPDRGVGDNGSSPIPTQNANPILPDSIKDSAMPPIQAKRGQIQAISSPAPNRTYILYDAEKGHSVALSKREELVCETWLVTNGNLEACARAVREKFGGKMSSFAVRKWMERVNVRGYLAERLKDKGVMNLYSGMGGKDRWVREAIEMRDGVKKTSVISPSMHKMIGQALGYLDGQSMNFNAPTQINVYQANGDRL